MGFQCKKGEIIAVVGPNAAGKSTLGKILSGLVKENSGTISYMGKRLKPSGRRGLIWYIMQDLDSQLFGEDLMDELLTGQKVTPERKQRAEEIFTRVGFILPCRASSCNSFRWTKTAPCLGSRVDERSSSADSRRADQRP